MLTVADPLTRLLQLAEAVRFNTARLLSCPLFGAKQDRLSLTMRAPRNQTLVCKRRCNRRVVSCISRSCSDQSSNSEMQPTRW